MQLQPQQPSAHTCAAPHSSSAASTLPNVTAERSQPRSLLPTKAWLTVFTSPASTDSEPTSTSSPPPRPSADPPSSTRAQQPPGRKVASRGSSGVLPSTAATCSSHLTRMLLHCPPAGGRPTKLRRVAPPSHELASTTTCSRLASRPAPHSGRGVSGRASMATSQAASLPSTITSSSRRRVWSEWAMFTETPKPSDEPRMSSPSAPPSAAGASAHVP
eukprot:scaffold1878_cov113-Isochrysis_galbana.AAC.5